LNSFGSIVVQNCLLYRYGIPVVCVLFLLTLPLIANSQTNSQSPAPIRSGIAPSERPLEVPALEPAKPEPPVIPIPDKPPPKPVERERVGPKVFIREIELQGNTVFSREDLAGIIGLYENRAITNEELQELRHALTLHYVDRGYINSGAVIPDQRITDGVVQIQIVEGRLTDILVEGNDRLRSKYISDRLDLGTGPPLNINELQEQVQIVLQDRNIDRINAAVRPGDRSGEAKLDAMVKESDPYELFIFVDNQISPSLGEVRGVLQGSVANLTGWGDSLLAEIGYAEGLNEFFLDYSIPVNKWDTTAHVWFDKDDFVVQEEPFDELDIEGDTSTLAFEITHPFLMTIQQRLSLGLGLEYRKSQTYLLGEGFAFSPGVPSDGKSRISVVRFTQDWLDRRSDQVIAARSSFRFGIDALDATINKQGPDGEFVSWIGQFQLVRRVRNVGDQLMFRAVAQLASTGLLPLEQFTVGGMRCGRGYRKNQLVRDVGYCASLEYRAPVLRSDSGQTTLQLATFADIGGAWYKNRSTPDPKSLSSIGLGLIWDPHSKVHGELYWGWALRDVDNPTDTLQDSGIHFLLSLNPY